MAEPSLDEEIFPEPAFEATADLPPITTPDSLQEAAAECGTGDFQGEDAGKAPDMIAECDLCVCLGSLAGGMAVQRPSGLGVCSSVTGVRVTGIMSFFFLSMPKFGKDECDCLSCFNEVSELLAGRSVAEFLTELGASGYVPGSEGKLTNATSPFLPRILIVRPVDGNESDLSEAAPASAAIGGGVGRPLDPDAFESPLGICPDLINFATGGVGALSVSFGESGTTGLYGLSRKGGTKNGLGSVTSDVADDLLVLSPNGSASGVDLAAAIAALRLSSRVACISLFASPSSMCVVCPVP